MFRGIRRFLKKSKLKVFLLFLFIAFIFWLLTKFSREYTVTVEAFVTYTNFPKNSVLAAGNTRTLSFDANLNGFEFLYYRLKQPSVTIDVKKFYKQDQQLAVVNAQELNRALSAQLKLNVPIKNIAPNSLTIGLDGYVSKKVPVRIQKNISFQQGFRAVDSVRATPDSVTISGPSLALEEVQQVQTEVWEATNLNEDVTVIIQLVAPTANEVSFSPSQVELSLKVDEFTQKTSVVPISLVSVPANIRVKLIPEFITLTYNLSVAHFQKVQPNDFKVICDYAERNEQGSFMVPKLLEAPATVQDIEMDTKKIDYLIFK
jgi:hypothetical protein